MEKYIITTRPGEKGNADVTSVCFDLVNIPVTKLEVNTGIEASTVMKFGPSLAIFTSSYGANAFLKMPNAQLSSGVKIVAIGEETAKALRQKFDSVIVPGKKTSEGVIELLEHLLKPGERVVLFVSSRSNGAIEHYLQEHGVEYLLEELYYAESIPGEEFKESALKPECFGIILTSSYEASIVFTEILTSDDIQALLLDKKIFAIGRTTANTLANLKIPVSEPLGESDFRELVKNIDRLYCPGE